MFLCQMCCKKSLELVLDGNYYKCTHCEATICSKRINEQLHNQKRKRS